MKNLLYLVLFIFLTIKVTAQSNQISKVILKNNDVLTGKIVEIKPGEYLKLEIVGNNIIQIPYSDIAQIVFDDKVTAAPTEVSKPFKSKKELKKFYFESNNELGLNLGVGKVYGYQFEYLLGQLPNSNVFGGLYSANGVGYNEILFAGLGIGFYGHSGLVEDNDLNSTFSIPFLLDLRYRPFKKYKFSPIIMLATGVSYYDGSIGTFTLNSGVGVSVKISERLHGQLLFCHTYERYSAQLSVNNKLIEDFYKGIYLNYAGPRIGVSYKF